MQRSFPYYCIDASLDTDNEYRVKARRQLHKDATSYIKQVLEATSQKTAAVRPPTTHLEDNPN